MDELHIACPYCGEIIDVLVDGSAGEQEYYEDCSVCCAPILFDISMDALSNLRLVVKRDDD